MEHTIEKTDLLNQELPSPVALVSDIVTETNAMPSDEEVLKMERLEVLRGLRITSATEIEPEQYSLTVDGVGIFALSDIHGLKGKQKSGKSAVLKVCTAALICGQTMRVKSELQEPVVLFLDTEQQAADVKLVLDEVKVLSGVESDYIDRHLFLYTLRRMHYDTLLNDTRLLIRHHKPQVVFVDGLVDYVASFNDEVMSRQLIHDLLLLCEENHCAIVCVLHENKATEDMNMRGHLGTVLSQKAGTVLQCQKQGSLINVTCPDTRHGQMPQWSITFTEGGHIMGADDMREEKKRQRLNQANMKRQEKTIQGDKERLSMTLNIIENNNGYIKRNELMKLLTTQLHQKRSTLYRFLQKQIKDKTLFENDDFIAASQDLLIPF